MPTTLNMRDFLGRKLSNATPGSTNATDQLGRAVKVGDADSLGRALIGRRWGQSEAKGLGDTTQILTGELLICVTAGTTSGSGTGPTSPGYGNTVVDGSVTWRVIGK